MTFGFHRFPQLDMEDSEVPQLLRLVKERKLCTIYIQDDGQELEVDFFKE